MAPLINPQFHRNGPVQEWGEVPTEHHIELMKTCFDTYFRLGKVKVR